MYTKYAESSMLHIGFLRQLAASLEYMHSTNSARANPKALKCFIRFAYMLCFLQVLFPYVSKFEKNSLVFKLMMNAEKQTLC